MTGKKLLKRDFKNGDGKVQKIEMKSNSHVGAENMNLVMVYHPTCKYSIEMSKHFSALANVVNKGNMKLNIVGINDGIGATYRKELPGNAQINYYPMILLFKNDATMSISEFNPNDETQGQVSSQKDELPFNFDGLKMFLQKEGFKF